MLEQSEQVGGKPFVVTGEKYESDKLGPFGKVLTTVLLEGATKVLTEGDDRSVIQNVLVHLRRN